MEIPIKHSRLLIYRKIPKISPRAYIFQRDFLMGLFLEELTFGGAYTQWEKRYKTDKVGLQQMKKGKMRANEKKKCYRIVVALFYFVFEGKFPSISPWGLIFGEAI